MRLFRVFVVGSCLVASCSAAPIAEEDSATFYDAIYTTIYLAGKNAVMDGLQFSGVAGSLESINSSVSVIPGKLDEISGKLDSINSALTASPGAETYTTDPLAAYDTATLEAKVGTVLSGVGGAKSSLTSVVTNMTSNISTIPTVLGNQSVIDFGTIGHGSFYIPLSVNLGMEPFATMISIIRHGCIAAMGFLFMVAGIRNVRSYL